MSSCLWKLAVLLAGCAALAMSATTPNPRRTTQAQPEESFNDEYDDDEFIPYPGQRFDAFDWQLCRALEKRESSNLIVSPIGIKLVLAMLYEGAAGETARQIQATLQLPDERAHVRRNYSNILASLQVTRPEYVLDIGSKLYTDVRTSIRKKYKDVLHSYYNSGVESVDFSDTSAAANKINSWVESVTHGKIHNLVSDAESMSSTVMLLVNAIFFKGSWRYPFNPKDTFTGRFHVTSEKSVTTQYMNMSNMLYYMDAPQIKAKVLRLPYTGKKYSMFVILPLAATGLKQLVTDINPFILHRHLWTMSLEQVTVTMPKFSFKHTSDLKDALKELGIREIFQSSASLPGIVRGRQQTNNRLYVSEVLQKAGVAVDEQGTEAYAATDINVISKFGDDTVYTFNATHPFIFFIEDETTGTVIFVGKVVDPTNVGDIVDPTNVGDVVVPTPRPSGTMRQELVRGWRTLAPKLKHPAAATVTTPRTAAADEDGDHINSRINDDSPVQRPVQNQTQAANQTSLASIWKELYNDRFRN